MSFELVKYKAPDFSQSQFTDAPDAVLAPAPKDKVAPENYHATTIFPEYFKVKGQWLLAEESRMDCVAMRRSTGMWCGLWGLPAPLTPIPGKPFQNW